MGRIFSALVDHLLEDGWKFEIIDGQTALRFPVRAKSGRLNVYADVDEDKEILSFYSYLPANTPPERYADMAEFITRANYGMRIGNFEMDYRDGELRYKTSLDIEGGELTGKIIENLLGANLSTMDRYFHGLMRVIYGDTPPAKLIESIENPDKQTQRRDDDFLCGDNE
jgi:hypothetical protein